MPFVTVDVNELMRKAFWEGLARFLYDPEKRARIADLIERKIADEVEREHAAMDAAEAAATEEPAP